MWLLFEKNIPCFVLPLKRDTLWMIKLSSFIYSGASVVKLNTLYGIINKYHNTGIYGIYPKS